MKVLWVSLVGFPPLCKFLKKEIPSNCGWLYSSAKVLLDLMPELKIGVIVFSLGKKYEEYIVEGVNYYIVPCKSVDKVSSFQIACCERVISDFKPDLIHIHGTEHSLAEAVCRANRSQIKIIANIQGLATGILPYVDGGLNIKDKIKHIALLDFYHHSFLFNIQKSMLRRAKCEEYVLTNITDVVGRTQWDHDHVITINPTIKYHFMNETLRDAFYEFPIWSYENCIKHTIFVSNSSEPIKGAHQVIKALPIILKKYPDTVVYFCGSKVMSNKFGDKIYFRGYHLYLRRMIKKLGLEEHVNFMGTLTEEQMKESFLNANVYVMPSAIENSSNSLCEAQLLGVPVVASYSGGTPSLVNDQKTGFLYRFEEVEMLAQIIIRLFETSDFRTLSNRERICALKRHNREVNAMRLIELYKSL